jgi:hypothetical protein
MLRPAIRLYPALWPAGEDAARSLARIERRHVEAPEMGDPPDLGREHWDAVLRAAQDAHFELRADRKTSWDEKKRTLSALAKRLPSLPVPTERDEGQLIALLPPPAELGAQWVAMYLHPDHQALAVEASNALRNEWNHPGVHVERVDVPPGTQPAIFHVAAGALVPVEMVPFVEIHPLFFISTVWTDERGTLREWYEAEDFGAMPTSPEPIILAQLYGPQTKIGGFPTFNASEEDAPLWGEGDPMRYAFHLATEFFDVEFGDAGSLHVWLSPSTTEFAGVMDSA